MPTDPASQILLGLLVLAAAVLYSSVGHAGASGYLAAMALLAVPPEVMKPAALVMNLGVAAVGTARFAGARLVPWRLLLPLCAGSVPAAFAGGVLQLPTKIHRYLFGVILLLAAVRLVLPAPAERGRRAPEAPWLVALGVALGFLAGLTGVGGGIFLSPLLILAGWENPKRTAGASAAFILANSTAGILGHLFSGGLIPAGTAPLTLVALLGGLYGSYLGARRFSPATIRRVLSAVLVVAGTKLLLTP